MEPKSYYFNLPLMHKYHKRSQTRTTPAIPQILGLRKQLEYIVEEEGIENRFARHDKLSGIVQDWAKEYFDIFPEEGYWSKTLTCVENTRGISVADLNQELIEDHSLRIANGYGDTSEETFRISNMADISEPEIRGLLATINEILDL